MSWLYSSWIPIRVTQLFVYINWLQFHYEFATNMVFLKIFFLKGSSGISLRLKPGAELVLSLDILFQGTSGSLTIYLENKDKKGELFPVIFSCSSTLIEVEDRTTIYGLGSCQKWTKLTRDLFIDLLKGHVLSGRWVQSLHTTLFMILQLEIWIFSEGRNWQDPSGA